VELVVGKNLRSIYKMPGRAWSAKRAKEGKSGADAIAMHIQKAADDLKKHERRRQMLARAKATEKKPAGGSRKTRKRGTRRR